MAWHQGEVHRRSRLTTALGKYASRQCYRITCEKIVIRVLFCWRVFVSVLEVMARELDVATPQMGVRMVVFLVVIWTVSCNLLLF